MRLRPTVAPPRPPRPAARPVWSATGGAAVLDAEPPVNVDVGPGGEWPRQVELILSALETGEARAEAPPPPQQGTFAASERRVSRRDAYRVRAWLRLFSDGPVAPPRPLLTRDVGNRGLGLIKPQRLPQGYRGVVELAGPDGRPNSVQCTLIRCRQAAPGWFEGCLAFNRDQPGLVPQTAENG
jgi:hypothetical protein